MSEPIRRRRQLIVGAISLAGLVAAGALVRLPVSPTAEDEVARGTALSGEVAALPKPRPPAFALGYVPALRPRVGAVRFAPVLERASVRTRPSARAAVVGQVERRTSLGTTNVVLVLGHVPTRHGLWVRVRFPSESADAIGWLPRERIGGYHFIRTRLHVDRRRLTATLFRDGRPVFRAAVGVGTPESPTPRGSFYVREKLTNFDDPAYGPVAFGTSARSRVLTDWPDGGSIGIHGTNRPELLPGQVSHGCIRLRNEDILRLGRLMPVGTPITIT